MNIINQNIEAINELCRTHKVKELYAFGSVTDENKFNEKSDVDLLVDFQEFPIEMYASNYFEFIDELEKLFQRPVDLLTKNSLHNRFLIMKLNESKKEIYCA